MTPSVSSSLVHDGTRSRLYEGRIFHRRFTPQPHAFRYRLFHLCIDLDELPQLHRRLRLFSVNRRNLFAFHETDYLSSTLPASEPGKALIPTLKQRVLALSAHHGVHLGSDARVELVTLPRIAGYLFNPVSFYFCYDRDGQLRIGFAEVTNTFREVKAYPIPASSESGQLRARMPKHFYVSPFSAVDLEFEFKLHPPRTALRLQVETFSANTHVVHSHVASSQCALTDRRLAWFMIKYPLATLQVIFLIHWEALRLWAKRLPYFRKADRVSDQRDYHRPSMSPRATS